MSGYFQPHGSEQFKSDREPDALVDSDPDGAYDYYDDVQVNVVPDTDQERDFEEEEFNKRLMREE